MTRAIAILLLTAAPVIVLAEDAEVSAALTTPVEPAVTVVQDYDWTGPSVGLGFGYIPDVNSGGDSPSGLVYGLQAAYDYDFGDYVVGGILSYGTTDIDFDNGVDVDDIWRIGIRAGIDAGRNWFYGSVGYTSVTTSGPDNPGDSGGYFIGLGYEVFLTEVLTAGAEIVYSDYSDFDDDTSASPTTLGLSLNYRF